VGDARRAHELATGNGPNLRAASERFARAALKGEMDQRPWHELLSQARSRGVAVARELDERFADQLELLARRDRRRAETEHAERARRARRRAETATLDLGLALVELWYRDLACVAWGAPELVLHSDRAEHLASGAEGRDPQSLRAAVELVDETRQRLILNVAEELACEALGYRLERLLAS
jgi:DNA polymerase-3 subunit delta'